ncbi:MAG: glycosyltransferase family 9 protein [Thermodesulfobacteriota bacterium]
MIVKGSGKPIESEQGILIVQLGDIGDVVLSFPVVRALKEKFPNARTLFVVREKAAGLARECPWADQILSVDQKKRSVFAEITCQVSFFRQLRSFGADLAVDLRTGTRGAVIVALSGARRRIGYYGPDGWPWRNRVFTDLWDPKPKPGRHMTEYLLSVIQAFGVSTTDFSPQMRVSRENQLKAGILLEQEGVGQERPLVTVQPFSLWAYKEWGDAKYADLISQLLAKHDVQVLIIGSPAEADRAEAIVRQVGGGRVHSLAGKTDIGLLPAVLEQCSLFIGGDSAGIHIAAAVGLPTVGIYGPASSACWAPRGERHRVASKDWPCVPCNLKGCDGNGISRCLESLTVAEVFTVSDEQLTQRDNNR